MRTEDWLKEDELACAIFNKKYKHEQETFDDFLVRVTNDNYALKELIKDKKFIFGGRILANRGIKNRNLTYSNCYVLAPPEDNIESIFETASKLARTYSYGGGCGIDISKLRPNGALVHNAAKTTCGPVGFMDLFSQVTATIGQAGRRGALMISLDINHPDIEEFIDCKTNLERVKYANISVRVTDEFMQAVESNSDYYLRWPCNETIIVPADNFNCEYNKLIQVENGYIKRIRAKDIFDKLVKNNWDYAEPGILYWDKITNYNIVDNDKDFEYAGTNPCVSGDTLIQTVEGEIPIKHLVGSTPFVYCMDEHGNLTIKKAIKVWKTRENANLVEVVTGKGKLICTPDHRIYTTNRGWVSAENLHKGDRIKGLNRQTTGHKYCSVGLSGTKYEKEHRFIARHFYDIDGMDVHHINDFGFDNRLSNLEVISHEEHSRLSNTGRLIEVNRDEETGRYLKKDYKTARTCVNLGKDVGVNWFVQEVNILDYTEDVYDMTVEDTHNFIANGFVVHNCAEEPLPAGGSCLLGSINLSQFVINPFTKDAKINWNDLEATTVIAIRGLNEVLMEGLKLHPLKEQQDSVGLWRQIGLGTMGLADMLIKLGIRYGSDKSIKIINDVYKTIAFDSVYESLRMAKEHGAYPACNRLLLPNSKFIKNLNLSTDIIEDIKKYGLYNSQLLTCAPTGSIGTMLQTSTGVEPNFAFKYTRKTQSLEGRDVYFEVDAAIVNEYKEITGKDKLPDYFVTSESISPQERVKVQAALQKWIDASISSTVNLPKEATVEDVNTIYMNAWKEGLKGITIYRSGCKREAVLATDNTLETQRKAPKRPKELEADLHTVKVKGEQFIVLVGLLNGKPYETFAFRPNIGIAISPHKGIITKKSKMHYNFKSDIISITELELANDNIEEKAATLYSSMLLRHGVDIKYIIKTAKKVNDNIASFTSALCRVLSKYIPEETIEDKCPDCGANLVRQEGCNHCPSCGYSKCG